MAYIGNKPRNGKYQKLDNLVFNGTDTIFDLTSQGIPVFAEMATNLIISISGVIQDPGVSYQILGNQIQFSEAPATTDSFFGVALGSVLDILTPQDGSITALKLSPTAITDKLGFTPANSVHTHLAANITDLSKSSVGLGNVDNTSDLNKPVSTATQTALDLKASSAHTHLASNITDLSKTSVGLGNVDNTSNATERAATATLTNKTITLGNNTLSGTLAQFNAALTDADFVSLTGVENLQNKQITTVLSGTTSPTSVASSASLQIMGDTTNQAYLQFHRAGVFAVNLGIDAGNTLHYGGWQAGDGVSLFSVSSIGNMKVKQSVSFGQQFNAGNSGASITINFANGQKQLLTLNSSTTVGFSFPGIGNYQLILTQDATGSRAVTWSGVSRYVGSATAPAINTSANSQTVVSIYYDGTNIWLAAAKVNA